MNEYANIQNMAELFQRSKMLFAEKPAFALKGADEKYQFRSYKELYDSAVKIAAGLLTLGVKHGDRIGIFADNRYEWMQASIAITLAGCVDVPRGADVTVQELDYIANHSQMTLVFVENQAVLEKARRAGLLGRPRLQLASLEEIDDTIPAIEDLQQAGEKALEKNGELVNQAMAKIKGDDLYTLIYTSGTTGQPKGVMLSHSNLISQVQGLPLKVTPDERIISILPVWHIFERTFELIALYGGCCTYYSSVKTLREDLRAVRPTVMASAPRLWESIYSGIMKNVSKASGIRRLLFHAAWRTSTAAFNNSQFLKRRNLRYTKSQWPAYLFQFIPRLVWQVLLFLPNALLDLLVLRKIRAATGGKLRATVSGGGALPLHVDQFFNAIGIPVLEGYGLTETSPVIAVRTLKNLVPGTVGPLYKNTGARIIDLNSGEVVYSNVNGAKGLGVKGELHVRGPQVTRGYFRNEEATSKVLKDGWFNTGDICLMTDNQCLKVVGRSKETIVLLGGENVEPGPIENKLLQSTLIQHCMVVGQDQKNLAALVVPEIDTLSQFGSSTKEISENEQARLLVLKEIKNMISDKNGFKGFERIVDVRLLPKQFEQGEELTAKLSVKRHLVTDMYQGLIQDMYSGSSHQAKKAGV